MERENATSSRFNEKVTCNLTYLDQSQAVGTEADWRSVLASAQDANGAQVHQAFLMDGDSVQAEWRDGALWIFNGTLNGLDPVPQ